MRSVKLLVLLISALTLSIAGCKKDKPRSPSGGGGGGGSSSADCCICEFEDFEYPVCEDDYSAEIWDQIQNDENCDCSTNNAGYICDGGCIGVTSGADYNSQSACEADCGSDSEYLVPSSGNNSITTCSGTIKDHAGDGNYDNNINGYTVINPAITGYNVQLSFTSFALEDCCDFVTVFDGTGTGGSILFNGNGTTLPPTITATNGPLTIRHTSDVSVTNTGFAANISCVPM